MHLWLSQIARLSAVAIHDKLVELMPQVRARLNTNLKDFEANLATTDKQVANELASVKGKGYFVGQTPMVTTKNTSLTPLGHFTVNPESNPVRSVYIK
ncbi:metal ABC transporter solute-binding protein, Zn/Mn family [Escherichia coli]